MPWLPLGPEPRPPVRTNVGDIGRSIRLTSNYYEVTLKTEHITLVHYDVEIKNHMKKTVKLPKKKRMDIFLQMTKTYSKVFKNHPLGFDSEKNAYGVEIIPELRQKSAEFKVELKEKGDKSKSKFHVILTMVNEASLTELMSALRAPLAHRDKPQFIMQMLEVMCQHTSSVRYERVGRNSFYSVDGEFDKPYYIGGGKTCILGFFASLKPAAWKDGSLLLNVDLAHSAFFKEQSVLDFMKENMNFREEEFEEILKPNRRRKLQKELNKMKIQVTHTPRKYTVVGVTELGADKQTFPLRKGQENIDCTVQKYFYENYRIRLKYPHLNCLHAGPVHKNIYLPIECCRIAKGQKVMKKLSDDETKNFIRKTATSPSQRLGKIKNIVHDQNFSADPLMRSLQFSVSDQPMDLDGRVLPPPTLKMNKNLDPRDGEWDARNYSFHKCAQLNCWVVVNYHAASVSPENVREFLELLEKIGRQRGMTITKPVENLSFRDSSSVDPEELFKELKQKYPKIQMIILIIQKFKEFYGKVKKAGDRTVGIITQCVTDGNVKNVKPVIVGNLLLKINAKLGGINTILDVDSRPVVFKHPIMIMGADVNHAPASDTVTPSLAAVVATRDVFASKYSIEVRHQTSRRDIIVELKEMTQNLLRAFYRTTGRKPEKIVMYRDGVSESEFQKVLSEELIAMRQACTALEENYTPAMTFVVVQKRHHTRLFCDESEGRGRSRNIPPGTTVDTVITHPSERDFYLSSHLGIQGTSRPTHYHVLWDDNDLSMNVLQSLTYAMCYLYSRCTRSVSIPTPTYYAHLGAYRGKVHIQDLCPSETSSLVSGEEEAYTDADVTNAAKMDSRKSEMASKLYYV